MRDGNNRNHYYRRPVRWQIAGYSVSPKEYDENFLNLWRTQSSHWDKSSSSAAM